MRSLRNESVSFVRFGTARGDPPRSARSVRFVRYWAPNQQEGEHVNADEQDERTSGCVWMTELPDGRRVVGASPDAVTALETISELSGVSGGK